MNKRRGLYIHIPFCKRKCLYCDFYSITDTELIRAYSEAVVRNIKAAEVCCDTVYFGGGTPSLLGAGELYAMLAAADISENAEITMECNPNSVDKEYFRSVKDVGINRISLGIQSLDSGELAALGRLHSPEEAVSAVNAAYEAGIENISADIMLATPYQDELSLEKTLSGLSALPLKHISAYMLKIEPETPFGRDKNIPRLIPDEDKTADMYLQAVAALDKYGFTQYEISNFARQGFESRHNLKYWRCEEYYGIGCRAHAYLDGKRTACLQDVGSFIFAPVQKSVLTSDGGSDEEKVMLGLRLTCEGIDLDTYMQRGAICKDNKLYSKLIDAGMAKIENGRFMLTAEGCLVSNEIICEILG